MIMVLRGLREVLIYHKDRQGERKERGVKRREKEGISDGMATERMTEGGLDV